MCDDLDAFIAEMKEHRIAYELVQDQGYGFRTQLTLSGGVRLGVYQPTRAPRGNDGRKER